MLPNPKRGRLEGAIEGDHPGDRDKNIVGMASRETSQIQLT